MLALLLLAADLAPFRPPAVPLVTHDPYFSIWSMTDTLSGGPTRHWTGTPQELCSLVRIDSVTFRILGDDPATPALTQTAMQVWPTRTIYEFSGGGIRLSLTFLTPALPHDIDVLSRPATYVIWSAQSSHARPHSVSVYFDASATLAVDQPSQAENWARLSLDGNPVLRAGSQEAITRAGEKRRQLCESTGVTSTLLLNSRRKRPRSSRPLVFPGTIPRCRRDAGRRLV